MLTHKSRKKRMFLAANWQRFFIKTTAFTSNDAGQLKEKVASTPLPTIQTTFLGYLLFRIISCRTLAAASNARATIWTGFIFVHLALIG